MLGVADDLLETVARPVVPVSASGSSMTSVAVLGRSAGVRTCFGPQAGDPRGGGHRDQQRGQSVR